MTSARRRGRVASSLALLVALSVVAAACSIRGGTLGGRDKCWPDDDPRLPTLWRGVLAVADSGGTLFTAEGDAIPLLPGTLRTRLTAEGLGELVRGDEVVAKAGDDLTLFGGSGGDGTFIVCAVEEIHPPVTGNRKTRAG